MSCSDCDDNKIVPIEYFEDIKVDNITIDKDVVERAKQNHADAIHAIGCEYTLLDKCERDIEWLGISAAMMFADSQLKLGHLFAKPSDDSRSYTLEWYMRAKENGSTSGTLYIATTLFEQKIHSKAKEYYQDAAEIGDVFCIQLGPTIYCKFLK